MQLKVMRQALPSQPDTARYPYLPLAAATEKGKQPLRFDHVFHRLRETRNDPDVYINE